ncbi:MAG: hypothetical protein LC655_07680, partial [Bacteroidales bacterium]|nr:hypothetical protein [Bacteroidales bacterium]
IDPQDSRFFHTYVDFGIDPELDYDAHYAISGGESVTQIEWSTSSKEGRIKSPKLFGDENWHCWDTELNDRACPDAK